MNIIYTSLHTGLLEKTKTPNGSHLASVNTAIQMSKRGHKVLYLCAGSKNKLTRYSDTLSMLEIESVISFDVGLPAFTKDNIEYLRDEVEKFSPDVCHAQNVSPLGLFIQKLALEKHIPFIVTLHIMPSSVLDFGIAEYARLKDSDYIYDKLNDISASFLYKDYLSNCTKIIALNNAMKADLKKFVGEDKIVVVPNGLDLSQYISDKKSTAGEKTLLFTGTLNRRKNQEFLIKAHNFLPKDVKLVLVGNPYIERHLVKLKELVGRSANNNIDFVGIVPHEKINDYLTRANVFVCASKREVQSLSVIEALASGTPVVALVNETTEEIIDNSVGRLLPRTCLPQEFALAVTEILNLSEHEYYTMSTQCKKRVQRYSWDVVCDELAICYLGTKPFKDKKDNTKPTHLHLAVYSLASILVVNTFLLIRRAVQHFFKSK